MSQHNFGSAVIPAMAGFFFGKRAKVQEIHTNTAQLPAVIEDSGKETGVTRYLMAAPLVSSVTKYLKKKDKEQVTGVAVYLLRKKIAQQNAPEVTSVTKYLSKVGKDSSRKKTCVDKYLLKQELAETKLSSLTGVARYQADQDLVARKKAATVLIQKYREEEAVALIARKAAVLEISDEQISVAEAIVVAEATATTGIGRYLQMEAKKATSPTTGVSKYIAKQIILESKKPALSKVSLYLRGQAANQNKKPQLTGVALYLSKLPNVIVNEASSKKQKLAASGVGRYLAAQANGEHAKPILTGVAKYLDNRVKEEASKVKRLENLSSSLISEVGVKSVEGEFIPANSFYANTGVSRYLNRVNAAENIVDVIPNSRMTGVSQYLNKQKITARESLTTVPTGVDRYLLRRVS